jgi:FtsZ-binding cell division protein ZapB
MNQSERLSQEKETRNLDGANSGVVPIDGDRLPEDAVLEALPANTQSLIQQTPEDQSLHPNCHHLPLTENDQVRSNNFVETIRSKPDQEEVRDAEATPQNQQQTLPTAPPDLTRPDTWVPDQAKIQAHNLLSPAPASTDAKSTFSDSPIQGGIESSGPTPTPQIMDPPSATQPVLSETTSAQQANSLQEGKGYLKSPAAVDRSLVTDVDAQLALEKPSQEQKITPLQNQAPLPSPQDAQLPRAQSSQQLPPLVPTPQIQQTAQPQQLPNQTESGAVQQPQGGSVVQPGASSRVGHTPIVQMQATSGHVVKKKKGRFSLLQNTAASTPLPDPSVGVQTQGTSGPRPVKNPVNNRDRSWSNTSNTSNQTNQPEGTTPQITKKKGRFVLTTMAPQAMVGVPVQAVMTPMDNATFASEGSGNFAVDSQVGHSYPYAATSPLVVVAPAPQFVQHQVLYTADMQPTEQALPPPSSFQQQLHGINAMDPTQVNSSLHQPVDSTRLQNHQISGTPPLQNSGPNRYDLVSTEITSGAEEAEKIKPGRPKNATHARKSSSASGTGRQTSAGYSGQAGLGKVFHFLDQMRLEVTNAERTIKSLQSDSKFLREKNKELEAKLRETERKLSHEKAVREAIELKNRALRKKLRSLKADSNTGDGVNVDGDTTERKGNFSRTNSSDSHGLEGLNINTSPSFGCVNEGSDTHIVSDKTNDTGNEGLEGIHEGNDLVESAREALAGAQRRGSTASVVEDFYAASRQSSMTPPRDLASKGNGNASRRSSGCRHQLSNGGGSLQDSVLDVDLNLAGANSQRTAARQDLATSEGISEAPIGNNISSPPAPQPLFNATTSTHGQHQSQNQRVNHTIVESVGSMHQRTAASEFDPLYTASTHSNESENGTKSAFLATTDYFDPLRSLQQNQHENRIDVADSDQRSAQATPIVVMGQHEMAAPLVGLSSTGNSDSMPFYTQQRLQDVASSQSIAELSGVQDLRQVRKSGSFQDLQQPMFLVPQQEFNGMQDNQHHQLMPVQQHVVHIPGTEIPQNLSWSQQNQWSQQQSHMYTQQPLTQYHHTPQTMPHQPMRQNSYLHSVGQPQATFPYSNESNKSTSANAREGQLVANDPFDEIVRRPNQNNAQSRI